MIQIYARYTKVPPYLHARWQQKNFIESLDVIGPLAGLSSIIAGRFGGIYWVTVYVLHIRIIRRRLGFSLFFIF